MGIRDGKVGFQEDVLSSRSIIQKGDYALLTPNGVVHNAIPGFNNCTATILSSPKIGATFVDYIVDMLPGGEITAFGGDGVETFAYVVAGSIDGTAGEETGQMKKDGYLYCPPNKKMRLKNSSGETAFIFLYKRRYVPVAGYDLPPVVFGNVAELTGIPHEGMDNLTLFDLLPAADNFSFDMNFHILSFGAGGCHAFIETHVQEHGAYILSGRGMYNLGNHWLPVEKNDYIFMGAYTLQAAYAIGKDMPFSYVYSKDCNRDELI